MKDKGIIKKIVLLLICVALIVTGIAVKSYKKAMKTPVFTVQSVSSILFENSEKLKLIAHRGARAMHPENTVPAFRSAGDAGYWGAECDIYRTSDGVWVVSHDKNIKRMMDGKCDIEKSTYDELLKYNVDNGSNALNYTDLKIATLDEYLDICSEFKMTAVIELKSENNTEHYKEITDAVAKRKLNVIYISFVENNLKEMRKLDSKAPMFYLAGKISDGAIETAKRIENCGLEFNAGEKSNFKSDGKAIKSIKAAGIEAACWGANDLETVKTLAGYEVYYVTTDCVTY